MAGPDLEIWEGVLRLLLALGLAGAVGFEREIHEQDAGLRTHMLVGMGSCLFVLIGNFAWQDLTFGNSAGVALDPSRVIAYVVTGIGFLGAGAILKTGTNVRGLTTAASLWVTAAIGATSAAGEYVWAVTAAGIILVSLWPLRRLTTAVGTRNGGALRVQVELVTGGRVGDLATAIEQSGAKIESAKVTEEPDLRRVELVVTGISGPPLLDAIARVDGVQKTAVAG